MTRFEAIESRVWRHTSGLQASIYGAAPWTSESDRENWTVVSQGWTVRNPHTGEVGACRPPFAPRELAEAFADRVRPSTPPSDMGIRPVGERPMWDKPMAADGLTSYRCKNRFGWTMIGARNAREAMREAWRSWEGSRVADLEVWNGSQYVPVLSL